MKIPAKKSSLTAFTAKWLDWWSARPNQVQSDRLFKKRHVGINQFLSWSSSKRYVSLLTPRNERLKVEVRLLEQFVEQMFPKEISYKGFIASHLQHEAIDEQSSKAMKKSIAIERMHSLIASTVADIKMIELNYVSKNKG